MSPGLFYLCHDYCCGTGEICFQLKSLMVSLCFRVPFASGSRLLQGPVCFRVLFASGFSLLRLAVLAVIAVPDTEKDLIIQVVSFKTGNLQ